MFTFKPLIRFGLNVAINNASFKTSLLSLPVKRLLYSPSSLGMEAFIQSKENVLRTLQDQDRFKQQLQEDYRDDKSLVFTNDIKKMVRLTENDDDIALLIQLIKRMAYQQNIRFSPFNLGPEIMRCFYLLNKPDEAFLLVKDDDILPLFSQIMSFLLLMNLLYKNNRHKEVIEVFNIVKDKQVFGKKYPASLVTVFFASCFKLNTPESYEQAENFWTKLLNMGFRTPTRAMWFFATLALNQNHTFVAIEVLSSGFENPIKFNIKAKALAQAKRYYDIFTLIKDNFFTDTSKEGYFITADTLEYLEKVFEESNDDEIISKLEKLKNEMIMHKLYSSKNLEDFLCEEMNYQSKKNPGIAKQEIRKFNY